MTDKYSSQHEEALNRIANGVDMPPSIYDSVIAKYEDLGAWLERDGSSIAQYDPFVTPQGSFRLGTANRPLTKDDEYDIDLICRLDDSKKVTTQADLKASVGREVIAYAAQRNMAHSPEDKRRCWTLKDHEDDRFHMDVLPCVPDEDGYRTFLENRGFSDFAQNDDVTSGAIAITDKEEPNYDSISDDWPSSNPQGYARWFEGRMADRLLVEKTAYFNRTGQFEAIDDVPTYRVKTPLQKVIQILKRHRDTMFAKDPEHKPISIIITTLAAKAYGNETSLCETLETVLIRMDQFIEERGGIDWVENPVNPTENFADKWEEEPLKKEQFFRWLRAARKEFGAYLNKASADDIPGILFDRLGADIVESALSAIKSAAVAAPAVITSPSFAERVDRSVEDVRQSTGGHKPYYGGIDEPNS